MRANALWSAYARTTVKIYGPDGSFEIHPVPVGQTGIWPTPFEPPLYVITAWDPGDDRPGDDANRLRQSTLEENLSGLQVVTWPAIGFDSETGHREEGVLVSGLSEMQALDFGRQYDQNAIFSWTPTAWLILSCTDRTRHESGWTIRTPESIEQ